MPSTCENMDIPVIREKGMDFPDSPVRRTHSDSDLHTPERDDFIEGSMSDTTVWEDQSEVTHTDSLLQISLSSTSESTDESMSPGSLSPHSVGSGIETFGHPGRRRSRDEVCSRSSSFSRRMRIKTTGNVMQSLRETKRPDEYTYEELLDLADRIRDPQRGVKVKTRYFHLRKYKATFIGSECVTWLVLHTDCCTRVEAVELGCYLVDIGLFFHVCQEHRLKDDMLFYRFTEDWRLDRSAIDNRPRSCTSIEDANESTSGNRSCARSVHEQLIGLTKDEINALVKDITHTQTGVEIKDRKYHLRTFKQCFVGSDLVTWMVKEQRARTREEAVVLCRFLYRRGIIQHVTRGHRFHDREYFYIIDDTGTRDPMEQKAIELLNAACGGKINDIKSVLIGYGLDLSINLCCMHNQRALPDKLAGAMAFFHYSFGELGSFLSHVMVKELGAFEDKSVLFRETSTTTVLLKMSFAVIPQANQFVKNLIGPLLGSLETASSTWEIDPAHAAEDKMEIDTRDNARMLGQLSYEFMHLFSKIAESCPVFLRQFLIRTESQVERRFPGMGRSVVGTFLFLRLICPSILAPADNRLSSTPLSRCQMKGAITITRILQKTATGHYFDTARPHSDVFNNLIKKLIPLRDSIYNGMLDPVGASRKQEGITLNNREKHVLMESTKVLRTALRRKFSELIELLATSMTVIPSGSPNEWSSREVSTWLDIIGMSQYSLKSFAKEVNGEDMLALCLTHEASWPFRLNSPEDRAFIQEQMKILMTARTSDNYCELPDFMMEWTNDDVCNWLRYNGFHQYETNFQDHHVDGAMLMTVTDEELCIIGIADAKLRATIVRAVDQRNINLNPHQRKI